MILQHHVTLLWPKPAPDAVPSLWPWQGTSHTLAGEKLEQIHHNTLDVFLAVAIPRDRHGELDMLHIHTLFRSGNRRLLARPGSHCSFCPSRRLKHNTITSVFFAANIMLGKKQPSALNSVFHITAHFLRSRGIDNISIKDTGRGYVNHNVLKEAVDVGERLWHPRLRANGCADTINAMFSFGSRHGRVRNTTHNWMCIIYVRYVPCPLQREISRQRRYLMCRNPSYN